MIHYGDITKISGYDVPIVDCVIGGSPCQDLSVAGKRAGLDGERSGLFMEQLRIIKEMRDRDARNGKADELIRPRFMVWENVPGAFSSNKGEDFKIVLEETAKIVDKDAVIPMPPKNKWSTSGCIVGDGWSIAWRILDAQFWGVPQRRRRIALVADFGGGCAQEILFERKSLRRHSAESRTERKGTTTDSQGCIGVCDRDGETTTVDKPYTLKIRSGCEGGGKGTLIQVDKSATLATNNDQYLFQSVAYGFDQGATRDVGVIFLEEQSKTLANGSCPGHHNGVVIAIENHPADSRVNIDESGKVQTLTSRMGTDGGNVPMVMVEGVDCYNQALTGDVAKSLTNKATDSDHIPCVVMDKTSYQDKVGSLCARDYKGVGSQYVSDVAATHGAGSHYTKTIIYDSSQKPHYIVRRLTPLECERLQGFADGWTDIGEYIDSNGKKKQSSDSARYKALGNSIALPPWKWVIKRLCSHYERDATMASLFDGIGGFPYLWEQINGDGSCLWASEIEDFPIAVTKARIG